MMKLTARQIKVLNEIRCDKAAAKQTLEIALNYHNNVLNELTKQELELWDELAELHGLNLSVTPYKIDYRDGALVIVEVEDEPKDKKHDQ